MEDRDYTRWASEIIEQEYDNDEFVFIANQFYFEMGLLE